MDSFDLRPIGRISSPLTDRTGAPRQSDEGAPSAWLVFDADVAPAIEGLCPGMDVIVLTWLHHGDRQTLSVHPRGDLSRPATGVFNTRSPDRPNPIGLHEVRITEIDGVRVRVAHLEAIDGTPILDVKPMLGPVRRR